MSDLLFKLRLGILVSAAESECEEADTLATSARALRAHTRIVSDKHEGGGLWKKEQKSGKDESPNECGE